MKKVISFILAISLIMSVFVAGSVSTSAAETETVIYSFDEVYNQNSPVTTAFNTNVAIEANEKTEGIGSTWMNFTVPKGQTANVGGMFFVDFKTAQDFSSYDKFRIDIFTPLALEGKGGRLQVNFVTGNSNQDGYNWDINIADAYTGWNTYTANKADIPMAVTANWASINRLRVTWFNESQIDTISFMLVDNLRGVTGEADEESSTPEVSEDGATIIHPFEDGQGISVPYNGDVAGIEYAIKTQGAASFKWNFGNPTGSNSYLFFDFPTGGQDLSKYDTFKIDIYVPLARTNPGGNLQMNFVTGQGQDGFNYDFLFGEFKQGWNTITINKSAYTGPGADWSNITRFRWFWTNDNLENMEYFLLDNLRGYVGENSTSSNTGSSEVVDTSKGHTPYAVGNDLMINNADSTNGWSGQFNSNIYAGSKHVEGTSSVALGSTIPKGQAVNIGAMAWFDFPATDLSSYSYISFKVRINSPLPGVHGLQMNFVTKNGDTQAQDGYNYNYTDLSDKNAGWYQVVIPMSSFEHPVSTTTWSSVDRIRFTWFNNPQIETAVEFIFDEIMAHKEVPESSTPVASEDKVEITYAHEPYAMEDGSLMIHNADTHVGWAPYLQTSTSRHPTIYKEGNGGVQYTGKQPMGNGGSAGAMAFIEIPKFSLENYETFSFQVYNFAELEGKHAFEINFITRTSLDPLTDQDGFNYIFDISGWEAKRWYTIRFTKEDVVKKVDSADWSKIDRIRLTWYNYEQIEISMNAVLDDFRAYPAGYELEPLPPDFINGDVSRDDKVTSVDALLTLQYCIGKAELSLKQQYIADVCEPSGVDITDALTILRVLVKKIDGFDDQYSKVSAVYKYTSYAPDPVSIPDSVIKNNAYGKDSDDSYDTSFKTETLGIKPHTVYVVKSSVAAKSTHHARLIYSLQGLMNRDFGMDDAHTSIMYVQADQSDYSWLDYFTIDSKTSPYYGFERVVIGSWTTFFKTFKPMIQQCGYIVWDPGVPASANVAATICGLDGYLPVMSGCELEADLKEKGIEQKMTLVGRFNGSVTGSAKNDAYRWALDNYFNRCSYDYLAYTVDGAFAVPGNPVAADPDCWQNCLENHDYLIARRAFFFDLNPCKYDKTEDGARAGLDLETMEMILDRRYNRAGGKMGAFMGFVPWWIKYAAGTAGCLNSTAGAYTSYELEWLTSEILACYNLGKEADAWPNARMTNGSVSYKYPVTDKFINKNKPEYTGGVKVSTYNPNVHYFTIYVGDYDSSAWLKNFVAEYWMDGESARGSIDLMWSINPNLANRVPMVFEYMYDNLTDCDYMAAGEGAGYSIPTGFFPNSAPRLYGKARNYASGAQAYVDYATKLYDLCDMDITGFLILGNNFLNTNIADMYRQFSPVAVFHQAPSNSTATNWNFAKRGNTPFIVCRQDDIKTSTNPQDLYNFSYGPMNSYGFSVFRTIVQSPDDIKTIVNNYIAHAAAKNKTVQYVDPYSFIYLANNNGNFMTK